MATANVCRSCGAPGRTVCAPCRERLPRWEAPGYAGYVLADVSAGTKRKPSRNRVLTVFVDTGMGVTTVVAPPDLYEKYMKDQARLF